MVKEHGMTTFKLPTPIIVRNVDNTENIRGRIHHQVFLALKIQDHIEVTRFLVSDLGKDDLILGHSWLQRHNPSIDWRSSRISFPNCPKECQLSIDDKWRHYKAYKAAIRGRQRRPVPRPYNRRTTQSTTLAATENAQKKIKTLEEMIPSEYLNHRTVFEEAASRGLPPFQKFDHAIDIKPGIELANNCKVYPLSTKEKEAMNAFVDDMLNRGYIRPSKSPFASPFFFVDKKDGKLRPVQDYRQLNSHTIKNQYPLPLISDTVDKLQNAKIFTKFDVRWGYNNVRIKKGDEWKAAFKTTRGMFEPLVMFFGLTNSPATFQSMMNEVFKDLIDTGRVFIYMDDILIATETIEEHRRLVHQVLQRLADHNLYLKPEKCEFEKEEVKYLGICLHPGHVAMDPTKLLGIAEWPTPTKLHDVRAFLGFAGFYRRFIRNFSHLARPLNDLTRKNTPWSWTTECEQAFQALKK